MVSKAEPSKIKMISQNPKFEKERAHWASERVEENIFRAIVAFGGISGAKEKR